MADSQSWLAAQTVSHSVSVSHSKVAANKMGCFLEITVGHIGVNLIPSITTISVNLRHVQPQSHLEINTLQNSGKQDK